MKYLNIDQYKDLCGICDQILAEGRGSIESISNGWLHVLNEHPSNLEKYKYLFGNQDGQWTDLIGRNKSEAVELIYSIHKYIKAVFSPDCQTNIDLNLKAVDTLLVSHLVNEDQVGRRDDFYYGALGDELHKQGHSCAIILINHTKLKSKYLNGAWSADLAPRIILDSEISLKSEFKIRKKMGGESHRLKLLAMESGGLKKKIYKYASEKAVSSEARSNLRIFWQLNQLFKSLKPKNLVVTYEGHAWERVAFASARNQEQKIQCIGYQHTVLFPNQHAVMRSLGLKYDPDIILTTGIKLKDKILRASDQLKSENIYCVGSHRREILAVEIEKKFSLDKSQILAAADGTLEENLLILDFILKLAVMMPNKKFKIRLHPIVNIVDISRRDHRINSLPENVFLSKQKLVDDLMLSSWIIYRGSGVSIQSVFAGVRPLYLHREGELKIDPLSDMHVWKKEIITTEHVKQVVESDIAASANSLLSEYLPAYEYCNDYQAPINLKLFMDIVTKAL
jgi:hypothetical protein